VSDSKAPAVIVPAEHKSENRGMRPDQLKDLNDLLSRAPGTSDKALIIGPDGESAAVVRQYELSHEEAVLLRDYKKFLVRRGYKEAVYCRNCWDNRLSDGTKFVVTDGHIAIQCRCRFMFFQGPTY
jgi:hypothetical protein